LIADSASEPFQRGLAVAGDITKVVVAAGALLALAALVRFLLSPPRHQRLVTSTSAHFAEAAGGTRKAQMGA
jgi:hypothetical protein